MSRAAVAAGALVAASLIGVVVLLATSRAAPPARCAAGMIPLGPRCCGEGQRLDLDRCTGVPGRCAAGLIATSEGCIAEPRKVRIEGGLLHVGPGDWEAQGVVVPYDATTATFYLDAIEVTEQRYAACAAAGACASIALTGEAGRAVAGVTQPEAARYCAWSGGELPTADQLAFAAAGAHGRRYPWGDTGAVCRRAAWGLAGGPCAEGARAPELAGSHPDGASPEGALDLAGNVAEWTQPRPGAARADIRGGSWADAEAATLRAWQRREVPVETRSPEIGFRCAFHGP